MPRRRFHFRSRNEGPDIVFAETPPPAAKDRRHSIGAPIASQAIDFSTSSDDKDQFPASCADKVVIPVPVGSNSHEPPSEDHASTKAENAPVSDGQMLKRRVVVPFNGDPSNPYMTSTEFVVDARYKHLRQVGTGRFAVVM